MLYWPTVRSIFLWLDFFFMFVILFSACTLNMYIEQNVKKLPEQNLTSGLYSVASKVRSVDFSRSFKSINIWHPCCVGRCRLAVCWGLCLGFCWVNTWCWYGMIWSVFRFTDLCVRYCMLHVCPFFLVSTYLQWSLEKWRTGYSNVYKIIIVLEPIGMAIILLRIRF